MLLQSSRRFAKLDVTLAGDSILIIHETLIS